MQTTLTIITGASRGMGLAMAMQRLQAGHALLCLSRHASEMLARLAAEEGGSLLQWTLDLAEAPGAAQRLSDWLTSQPADRFSSAELINNAGVIGPIAPLREADEVALVRGLRVGLEAPMLLTAAFLRATESWAVPRKVLNISSGLGRRPAASLAGYCTAKAGLDHFTRCLALEEALRPHGARVCALAPGVIETGMQEQLRGAAADEFPDRPRYEALKAQGQLTSPEVAAARVLAWLDHPDFGVEAVADVRDAQRPA